MNSNLYTRLAGIAKHAPGALAFLAPKRKPSTYENLLAQIDETARWLAFKGIRRTDRVALVMPNGPEMATLFLGVSSVCVCAPLNPAYKANELEFYLSDLKPKLVIVDASMDSAVRAVAGELNVEVVELYCRELGVAGSYQLGREEEELIPEMAVDYCTANDVALVLHTSGTTSRPKIVPLTHENLAVSAHNIAESLELSGGDRCLNIMPLFHVHGLVGAVLSSLIAGASVVCTPGYKVAEFFEWLMDFQPTWYTGVPTMHHGIVTRARVNRSILAAHSLRFIRSCSSALAPELGAQIEEVFGVPVLEAYGMTEAAHQISCNGLPPRTRKPGSVGQATGVEVAIMNDASALLPAGAVGEVVIRGRNVTQGYENNREANLRSFTDGWFRTGDQGHLDEDGYLFLTGRIKELIVRGGEKISPREIDEVLLLHPAVEQALAFALPDAVLGEKVAAAVVLKVGTSATELELCEHAAGFLANFKVPEKIVFVAEIPTGPTGKLQRIGLAENLGLGGQAERERQQIGSSTEYCPPRNETEKRLSTMWCEILKLGRSGVHDNFFDAGGDSILASELNARIRFTFGVELSAPRLFQLSTIAELAEFIEMHPAGKIGDVELPFVNRSESVLLTSAQQRMCLFSHFEPDIPMYNRPFAWRLKGTLDPARLQQSLGELVKRNEILRTNYRERDGRFSGVVNDPYPVQLARTDLIDLPVSRKETAIAQWLRQETARSFNLETDPVLRSALAQISPDEYVLLLVIHHIACDASSESVLVGDLAKAYNGVLHGTPCGQYADYAVWQNSRESAAIREGLAWWKQQLADVEELSELRGDFARPQKNQYESDSVPLQLDADALDQCKALARAANTTIFTVLLAAFDVLLNRYTGAEDIVVGTPVAVRNHPATQSMVGLFINTLALRTNVAGDPTFREFLDRVRDTVNSGLEHQEVPFDAVVDALQPGRSVARSALFQVIFQYRSMAKPHLAMESIVAERIEIERAVTATPFDLTLDIEPGDDGLRGSFYYNTGLYERSTIERLSRHFATLLNHANQAPGIRISQLRLNSTEEEAQLLALGSPFFSCLNGCVHTLFESQVARTPDRIALVYESNSLTYRELNARANRLAHYLLRWGVQPGEKVGITAERSPELIAGILAILKAGAAYVPIDPAYPIERRDFMIHDCGIRILLAVQSGSLFVTRCRVDLIDVRAVTQAVDGRDDENPPSRADVDSPAYVMYTSGSTGRPKGVEILHRGIVRLVVGSEIAELNENQIFLQLAPVSFDASTFEIWGALLHGAQLVLFTGNVLNVDELGAALSRYGVTTLWLTSSLFNAIVDTAPGSLAPVRQLLVGGEALSVPHVIRAIGALPDTRLVNGYGPTECTTFSCCYPIPRDIAPTSTSIPIGRPIANTRVYNLDRHLRPVPVGVVGELYIGGDGLALGYLNLPELTKQCFVNDPFVPNERIYKTGDLVRYLPDGNLEFVGRSDHQVKIGGHRIELGEVEEALRKQPPIVQSVVVVREDMPGDKRLVAYLVAAPGMSPAPSEVRSRLRQRLPDYMVPTAFVYLKKLPISLNGKIDRKALPAPEKQLNAVTSASDAPRDPLEEKLVRIWAEVLGVQQIGIRDNFFEMGGYSLLAVRLFARILAEIPECQRSLSSLVKAPTVEQFAHTLRGVQAEWSYLVPMREGSERPPFFCVHGAGGHVLILRDLAMAMPPDQPFYCIQSQGLDGYSAPFSTIEEAAACYVEQIRKIQRHGPYFLGGFSSGGSVAYEMARTLQAMGETVSVVALLDSINLFYARLDSLPKQAYFSLCFFLHRLQHHLGTLGRIQLRDWSGYVFGRARVFPRWVVRLARKTAEGKRGYIPKAVEAASSQEHDVHSAWLELLNRVEDANTLAAEKFTPKPYDGHLLVFISNDREYALPDRALGWRALARGGVTTYEIDGDHEAMLRNPNVSAIAERLNVAIREAQVRAEKCDQSREAEIVSQEY